MPRRYAKKSKPRGGRKGNRKSKIPRSVSNHQMAKIIETIEYNDFLPNLDYKNFFSLGQFGRASALAPSFRWYKAALVEYSYEPLYNFFREDPTVPQPTTPYFYSIMNRTQDKLTAQLADIQAMGAKPTKFVSKIVKKYKPNWCSAGLLSGAPLQGNVLQSGLYMNGMKEEWGWLACPTQQTLTNIGQFTTPLLPDNAALNGMTQVTALPVNTNQVVYNGHDIYIEQANAITGAVICKVSVTVHWMFKDPASSSGVSQPTPIFPKEPTPE